LARLGLCAAHDGGDLKLTALVRDQGAEAVWQYLTTSATRTALTARARAVDVPALVADTVRRSARFVVPGDPEWPVGLDQLAWSEPVSRLGGEPFGLWLVGRADLPGMIRSSVAIVGSRASTAYGEHVAAELSAGLAEAGYTIVSGGAYGIDAAAHRAALGVGGRTMAVMAGGLAEYYPPGNARLIGQIADAGLVISEYPPPCPPSRARFLVRNRLIAALSRGTVIVEGAERSGAQNTVSWALSLGRPVLAVPGPVTSATSVTPHRLIRDGLATLVTDANQVRCELEPLGQHVTPPARQAPSPEDELPEADRQVLDALGRRRWLAVDDVVAATGRAASQIMAALGRLKQAGLVDDDAVGQWRWSAQVVRQSGQIPVSSVT